MITGQKRIMIWLLIPVCLIIICAGTSYSQELDALNGLNSIKAIFDFRSGSPKSAALQLDLIHQTFKDKGIRAVSDKPEFVVVFMGPSVKLISGKSEGFSPEEQKLLEEIAGTVSRMSKDGIKFEVCMFAAKMMNIAPASILPDISQIANGWISLIGYQAKGYSIVPAY